MRVLFTFIFSLCIFQLQASFYTFTKKQEAYQELSSPNGRIPYNSDSWHGGQILLKTDMKIKAYGVQYDLREGISMDINKGKFSLITTGHSFTLYAYHLYMQPREHLDPTTALSYKLDTKDGIRVFKLQFKNMGFVYGWGKQYINYQVWYYENGIVEVRFGPNDVDEEAYHDEKGPAIGLLHMDDSFYAVYDKFFLSGEAANPQGSTGSIGTVTGTPKAGTVYRFEPGNAASLNESPETIDLSVYPNPAKNTVSVKYTEGPGALVRMTNAAGQVISETQIQSGMGDKTMDISGLPSGIYILNVQTASASRSIRLVKQ